MVNNYLSKLLSLLVLCLCFSTVNAQDCDNPTVIIDDNLDSYTLGALGPQAAHWTTWSGTEGGAEDGIVSSDQSSSPDNSMYIQGTAAGGGPQDVLLLLGNKIDGNYILGWNMFVPEGNGAYYNIQHSETAGQEWAHQITFGADGSAALDAGLGDVRIFDYPQSAWFSVDFVIDVTNDFTYLYLNEEFVYAWPLSWQNFTMTGLKQLGSVDFFPIDPTHVFYVDDIYYAQIPEAGANQYCHMASAIDVGNHVVADLACFGGPELDNDGSFLSGAWYSYTPTEDGVMSVSSCDGGSDSRVWIYSGDCGTRTLEGVNDDNCEISVGGGDEWASYREVLVSAGTTYYLAWDNTWDNTGFDFDLSFTAGAGVGGDFCETATVIDPGIHSIDQINGDAAVAGPMIGNFASSTTPYSQSEWYSFTPEASGNASIASCGMTGEDTRVWVYSGTCGFDNITMIAGDDDGCDIQSLIMDLPVTAGDTYYIEWSSEDLDAPGFDWELSVEIPTVNVTFRVDMTGQTIDPLGVNIAGDFTNLIPMAMTDVGGNVYEASFDIPENTAIGWKYLNGLTQEPSVAPDGDLAPCGVDDTMGGFARAYMTNDQDFAFDPACFGYCVTCNFINAEEAEFEAALNLSPNPASNTTYVNYNFQEATDLNIRLMNSIGQLISTNNLDKAQNGSFELNIADLASGTYHVVMTNGEYVVTKRLIVN